MKLRMLLDTFQRNFRMTQWPKTVINAFEEPAVIVKHFHGTKVIIDANPHLTTQGKVAARADAAKAALAAIKAWHATKIVGLDTQVAQHRAALVPQMEKPDPRKVEYMLSQLQRHTPQEIATFYNAATDEERLVMEAASASVGRIPVKSGNGLTWEPLIAPDVVYDSVLARATTKNPAGVAKYNELSEIRAMHVTVANHAEQEIKEGLGDHQLGL